MFFVLSKVLGFFAIPSNLIILMGGLGLLLLPSRFARAGRMARSSGDLPVHFRHHFRAVGLQNLLPTERNIVRYLACAIRRGIMLGTWHAGLRHTLDE